MILVSGQLFYHDSVACSRILLYSVAVDGLPLHHGLPALQVSTTTVPDDPARWTTTATYKTDVGLTV